MAKVETFKIEWPKLERNKALEKRTTEKKKKNFDYNFFFRWQNPPERLRRTKRMKWNGDEHWEGRLGFENSCWISRIRLALVEG